MYKMIICLTWFRVSMYSGMFSVIKATYGNLETTTSSSTDKKVKEKS
jgi:hypothetical protein